MHFSTFAAGVLAITGTVRASNCKARAVCNADNCARLVTGTQTRLPSTRLADCSSYQTTTVKGPDVTSVVTGTDSTSIVTGTDSTSTVTVTPIIIGVTTVTTIPVYEYTTATQTVLTVVRQGGGNQFSARAAATNATFATNTVPAYAASSCPASRYASACSCAGVTAATSTVPGTTITSTVPGTTIINTVPGTTVTVTVTAEPVESDIPTAATTTVQSTAVATDVGAVQTGYACGSVVRGNGIYSFRSYRVNCGQRVTSGQPSYSQILPQESACLRICNSIKYCVYAEYAFSTGTCNLYYTPPSAIVDDPDRDALILI